MEGEMEVTVGEVLAFLEAFEADEEKQEQQKQVERPLMRDGGVPGASEAKKRRVEAKYTTNLQRKKRAEISQLREQVVLLEARLEQVRRMGGGNGDLGEVWMEFSQKTVSELMARRRAEKANTRLRSRIERYAKLRKDIGRLIDKQQREDRSQIGSGDLPYQVAKISSITAMSARTGFSSTESNEAMAEGLEELDSLVKQVDCVFSNSFFRARSCCLEVNAVGNLTEIRSSTTADCGVKSAADMLWWNQEEIAASRIITTCEFYTKDGSLAFRKALLPIECRTWNDLHKSGSASEEVLLHVEHYARRLYDASTDCTVLVMLAFIRLSNEDQKVLLRERFWKRITPVDKPKGKQSITHTHYFIEPGNGQDREMSPVQASVMRALVQLTRRNHSMLQGWLLEL